MRNLVYLSIAMLLALCSCGNKKTYRPSQFPGEKSDYTFAIPYSEKSGAIKVRIRLNGGPEFEGTWDSGCSLPLKISSLEAKSLIKDGTLSESDYQKSTLVTVANGQTAEYNVYNIRSISFMDEKGIEHTLTNVSAVIDENVGTDILIGLPVMQALGYSHEISQYDRFIYIKE